MAQAAAAAAAALAAAGGAAAAAPAVGGAQLQQALANHERIRKSTELPLFFGRKDKDTCEAQLLIDRFESAARIANWHANARKCEEFYLLLRDKALQWWKALDEQPGVNKANWDQVKAQFLGFYGPRHAARAVCSNFGELTQRSGEGVHDYYLRVMEVYQKIKEIRPPTLFDVRVAGQADAVTKLEGIEDMGRYFMLQLFLAGLREDIKVKTMENVPDTLGEALTQARNMEVIMNDKRTRTSITSIQEEYDIFEEKLEGLDHADDVIEHINLMRMRQGRKPFTRTSNGSSKGRFADVVCRYCKIKGHMQNLCRKRIAARAPCVDEKGAPFKKVNNVQQQGREDEERSQNISLVGYYDVINSIRLN